MPNTPTAASAALDGGIAHDARRASQLKADISRRLRHVCAHLTDDQFAALVDDIAQVTLRYETPGQTPPPARRGD